MKPSGRIVVAGSIVMDLSVVTGAIPRAGETAFGSRFELGFGGKGANQAAAASLCGAEVSMIGRVGDDLFGPAAVRDMASFGIDVSRVRVERGASTGAACVLVDPRGQNRIMVVKGANDALSPADLRGAVPALNKADFVLLQLEIPFETVYAAMSLAKSAGARVVLNAAPATRGLDARRAAAADYLIVNESEGESLSGIRVRGSRSARACAGRLLKSGYAAVILTLGVRGCLLARPGSMVAIRGFPARTVDATGAGDAFIGSFAAFLARGIPEREALSRASFYAALSTEKFGTRKSYPGLREFERSWGRPRGAHGRKRP